MSGPPPNHSNFLGGNANLNQIALAALHIRQAVQQQQQNAPVPFSQHGSQQRFPANFNSQMCPPSNIPVSMMSASPMQPQFSSNMQQQQQNFGNPIVQLNSLTTGLLQLLNVPGLAAALQGQQQNQQQTAFHQQSAPSLFPLPSQNVQTLQHQSQQQQQKFEDRPTRSITPKSSQNSANRDSSKRYGSNSRSQQQQPVANKESQKTGGLRINFKSNKNADINKRSESATADPNLSTADSVTHGDGLGLLAHYGGDGLSDDSRSNTPKPKKMRLEEGESNGSTSQPIASGFPPATNFSFAFPPPPMGQRMPASNSNYPFPQGQIPFPPPPFFTNVPPPPIAVVNQQPPPPSYSVHSGQEVIGNGGPKDPRKRKFNADASNSDMRVVARQEPIPEQQQNSLPVTFRCRVMPIVPLTDESQMSVRPPRGSSRASSKGKVKLTQSGNPSDSGQSSDEDSDDNRPQRYKKSYQDGLVGEQKKKKKKQKESERKVSGSSFSSEESDTESLDGDITAASKKTPESSSEDETIADSSKQRLSIGSGVRPIKQELNGEKFAINNFIFIFFDQSLKILPFRSDGEVSDSADNFSIASTDLDELGSDISETEEEDDEVVTETRLPPECWMQTAPAKLYFNRDPQVFGSF